VLDGLRGEHSIAGFCRREGIAEGPYYSWSTEFLEAGKRPLAGDTGRGARLQPQEAKKPSFCSLPVKLIFYSWSLRGPDKPLIFLDWGRRF
jgi:hypothetical protein